MPLLTDWFGIKNSNQIKIIKELTSYVFHITFYTIFIENTMNCVTIFFCDERHCMLTFIFRMASSWKYNLQHLYQSYINSFIAIEFISVKGSSIIIPFNKITSIKKKCKQVCQRTRTIYTLFTYNILFANYTSVITLNKN